MADPWYDTLKDKVAESMTKERSIPGSGSSGVVGAVARGTDKAISGGAQAAIGATKLAGKGALGAAKLGGAAAVGLGGLGIKTAKGLGSGLRGLSKGSGGIGGSRYRSTGGEVGTDWVLFFIGLIAWALQADIFVTVFNLDYSMRGRPALYFIIYVVYSIGIFFLRDFGNGPKSLASFSKLLLYFGAAGAYSLIGWGIMSMGPGLGDVLGFVYMFFPLYPTYIAATTKHGTILHNLLWWWIAFIIIVLILFVVFDYQRTIIGFWEDTGAIQAGGQAGDAGASWFGRILSRLGSNINDVLWQSRNPNVRSVEDPRYSADVEEGSDLDLGVFVDEFEPYTDTFYWDEEMIVTGLIRSESLLDRPVDINVVCNVSYDDYLSEDRDDDLKSEMGEVDNDGHIVAQGRSSQPFSCFFGTPESYFMESEYLQDAIADFNEQYPEPGYDNPADPRYAYRSIDFAMTADFDFSTWGTITYLFMDRDQKVNLERAGKDLFSLYGVYDEAEFTYTRGPVALGSRDTINPIGIEADLTDMQFPQKLFTFTATIDNNWGFDGRIKAVDYIIVHVPNTMRLETYVNGQNSNKLCRFSGPYTGQQMGDARHQNQNYVYYFMPREYLDTIKFTKDRDYMTIVCPVVAESPEAYQEILGLGGVSLQTFVLEADYRYELLAETSASVEYDPALI